jgi:hypothetical protein
VPSRPRNTSGCSPSGSCRDGASTNSGAAFISARIFRAAFGTDRRDDIAKYVIAVEVPSHAEHSQHDADPGFQEFNRLADAFQPEDPLVYGGQVLHAV